MTTAAQIIYDTLPRLAGVKPTGTTIYQAINYISSMVGKRLLSWDSDLLSVQEEMWMVTPGTQYYTLPFGFVSLSEKPRCSTNRTIEPISRDRNSYDGRTAYFPEVYEVLGQQIVFYPDLDPGVVSVPVKARYFALPPSVSAPNGTIPFNGMFDQAFFQGVPRVVVNGLAVIQADPDFAAFLAAEVDSVLAARQTPIPANRMRRSNYI